MDNISISYHFNNGQCFYSTLKEKPHAWLQNEAGKFKASHDDYIVSVIDMDVKIGLKSVKVNITVSFAFLLLILCLAFLLRSSMNVNVIRVRTYLQNHCHNHYCIPLLFSTCNKSVLEVSLEALCK